MARAKKKSDRVEEEVAQQEIAEVGETAETSETVDLSASIDTHGLTVETVSENADVTEETASEEETVKPEMTQDDIRLVEAILFASATAVDERSIAERFPADRTVLIPDILEHLKEQYAGRGVNLVQRDRRWALRTATDLGEQLRLEREQPRKFTRAAMETMAIIAYHQPVTRAEIENIRGVATSPGALDTLMEAGWIKPGKRREVPGRPVTWLSTQVFLDHFGLEKLSDLPGMDELKAAGLLDKRPAIEAMPTSSDLFDANAAANRNEEDPQEVTDEDLLGGTEDDTVMETEEAAEESEKFETAETADDAEDEVSEGETSEDDDLDDEDEDDSDNDEDEDDEDEDEEDEE
jgi:segregation and condensation protein B